MTGYVKITFEDIEIARRFFENERHLDEFILQVCRYYIGVSVVFRYKIVKKYFETYKKTMNRVIKAREFGSKGGLQRVENQQVNPSTLEGYTQGVVKGYVQDTPQPKVIKEIKEIKVKEREVKQIEPFDPFLKPSQWIEFLNDNEGQSMVNQLHLQISRINLNPKSEIEKFYHARCLSGVKTKEDLIDHCWNWIRQQAEIQKQKATRPMYNGQKEEVKTMDFNAVKEKHRLKMEAEDERIRLNKLNLKGF